MTANGRLPDSSLGTIPGTNHRVLAELVPQTAAMRAAFAAHFGKPLGITDSYRTLAEQYAVKAIKKNLAATPGTSNHGWGRALDLASNINVAGSAEHRWIVEFGPHFGWHWPAWAQRGNPRFLKSEPWHFEATYVSGYGSAPAPAAQASQPKPQSQSTEVEDMTPEQAKQLSEVHWMLNQIRSTDVPAIQKETKRLGHIHAQADLILAATTNITNGVVGLIKKIGG